MAFLGIKIPVQTARLLADLDVPGERTGVHEMHVTILMFEDNWPIKEVANALEAAYDIVAKTEPFTIKTKKVISFPPKKGKPHPVVALVESKELHELSKKLRRKFNKEDIEFDKTFKDYNPHITLAYADEAIKDFKIDPVEVVVQELVLFGGDHGDSRICVTFPLKSPEKHGSLVRKCEVFEKWAADPEEVPDPNEEAYKKAMFEEQYRNDMDDARSGTPHEKYAFILTYKDLLKKEKINDFWAIIGVAEMDFRAGDDRLFPQWVANLGTIDPFFALKVKEHYVTALIGRLQNHHISSNVHRNAIQDLNDWQDFFTNEQMRDILKMLLEKGQKDEWRGEEGLVDDLEMLALHNDKVDKKLVWRLLRQFDPKRFSQIQPTGYVAFDKEKYTTDDVVQVIEMGQLRYKDLARIAERATLAAKQLLQRVIWWGDMGTPHFIFDESMKPMGLDGYGDPVTVEIHPDVYVTRAQNILSSAKQPSEWIALMKDYQIIPYPNTFNHIDPMQRAASKKYATVLKKCEVFEKWAISKQIIKFEI